MSTPDSRRNLLSRLWRPDPDGPNILSTTFAQPLGRNFEPGRIGGYYIDLYVKSPSPHWPQPWSRPGGLVVWVATTQFGLGAHERYLDGLGEQWLEAAISVGDQLVAEQECGGSRDGSWLHNFDYPHTIELRAPWTSAIAQGQGASLLVRLARLTSDSRYTEAATRALQPMRVRSRDGGVAAELDGGYFPEEYPTDPPSFVLNGGIFGLWGAYDVAIGLDDRAAAELFDAGVKTLESSLHRYDTGYWSRYDLYPHRVMNIASAAYHELHIDQLKATAMLSASAAISDASQRFQRYQSSRLATTRAFGRKVLFRLAVPRNPLDVPPMRPDVPEP